MNQDKRYKLIIAEMIKEYKYESQPQASKLYFIIAQYLDEETEEEINHRVQIIKEVGE